MHLATPSPLEKSKVGGSMPSCSAKGPLMVGVASMPFSSESI